MSDSHFTVTGTWEDTLNNLKSVHNQVHFDMLIHLRDLTGIGCNKCEQSLASKNFGDVQPGRELNDKTQDLWDVVLLHSEEKEIDMVRFGAGRIEQLYVSNME